MSVASFVTISHHLLLCCVLGARIIFEFSTSSRSDPDDDVVDVTSCSALDVVEIKCLSLVISVSLQPMRPSDHAGKRGGVNSVCSCERERTNTSADPIHSRTETRTGASRFVKHETKNSVSLRS